MTKYSEASNAYLTHTWILKCKRSPKCRPTRYEYSLSIRKNYRINCHKINSEANKTHIVRLKTMGAYGNKTISPL